MVKETLPHILIIGAGGGIGAALVEHYLAEGWRVTAWSRQQASQQHSQLTWYTVDNYDSPQLSSVVAALAPVDGVISTLGMLHTDSYGPEKNLAMVSATQLQESFMANAILPILLLQQLHQHLPKQRHCFWLQLSAMVGSITDNRLGGWYSYRASKAALNMLLKTAAIELGRSHKQLVIAAVHPGTTATALSAPFQRNVPADKLYSPAMTAQRIASVAANLTTADSGKLLHWDGSEFPY